MAYFYHHGIYLFILLLQFITTLLDTCTYIRVVNNLCISIDRSNSSYLIGVVCTRTAVAGISLSAGSEPTIKCCSAYRVLLCRQVIHALAATGEHCYSEFPNNTFHVFSMIKYQHVCLIFVVPCIMLNSEIIPTRCNNCVYSSQWLYSICFG